MCKKIWFFLFAACLAAALTACGTEGKPQPPQTEGVHDAGDEKTGAASGEQPTEYTFLVDWAEGFPIAIDDDMRDVLDALGEPGHYFEAASCAFEGLDKSYDYGGFIITTRPDDETDYVSSILLVDDSVATPEGVYIGCTADDVTAAYGPADTSETVLRYESAHCAINFIFEGDTVVSIEYLPR